MEEILRKLLLESDKNVIEQATEQLKEIFKKPESSTHLFQLMLSSQNPTIRQYAAVLLTRHYSKLKNWIKLSVEARTEAKQLIVQSLSQETEKKVWRAVVQLTRVTVRHELASNEWPQIFETIRELSSSENLAKKELGIYTFAKVVEISTDAYTDHAASIIDVLIHILQPPIEETNKSLLIQALESLTVLIKNVEIINLTAAIDSYLDFGLNLVQSTRDPDIRKTVYGLFASISRVLKKNMAPTLPRIVECILESLSRAEDDVNIYNDQDPSIFFPVFDIGSDVDEGDEDIEDYDDAAAAALCRPKNSYVQEKMEAVSALREIAEYSEEAFLPCLEKSFEETFKLTSYSQVDMREAAIDALLQFCLNLSKISTNECRNALLKELSVFVPKLSDMIRLDSERSVAMRGMWACVTMLKEIKGDFLLAEGHRDAIFKCVNDVLMENTKCQDRDNVAKNNRGNEAEEDETLTEYASEVFSALGKVIPPENFAEYFRAVLPTLSERCKSKRSEARRSMAIGMIAKCMSGLKQKSGAFVEQLLTLFYGCSSDECRCVRHNAFWGLGELILHSKEVMFGHYESALSLTEAALTRETEAGPRDNMIGVIARMIITNYSILDINRVFSLFVEKLPLRQDFVEYEAVFAAVSKLVRANHEIIKPAQLQNLLILAINVLHENKAPNEETIETIMGFVKSVNRDFVNVYDATYSQLPPEIAANMMRVLS